MLRGLALRGTRPRVAVLSAVYDHPHADTDSITSAVREDLGEVSHQAVYDVLRTLTAADLVRRFQPTGSVARYERGPGTTTTTSSAGRAVPSPMSTALSATPPASRPSTTQATRSTKPRSSTGADVPSASRQLVPPRRLIADKQRFDTRAIQP